MKAPTLIQRSRSRRLRHEQTEAEQRLWQHLRNRQIAGAKFRRQLPIGEFVIDFCCLEVGLVVEADGGQHAEQLGYDERRTKLLESEGFTVLRFWNNEVMAETDSVVDRIRVAVEECRERGMRYGSQR